MKQEFDIEELEKRPYKELTRDERKFLNNHQEDLERENQRIEREMYEDQRNALVFALMKRAVKLNADMAEFKALVTQELKTFRTTIELYGDLSKKSLGGFSLVSHDGLNKVIYSLPSQPYWDERAKKAEELLKEFLSDAVQKRDRELYEILMSLIERNKDGNFEYSRINTLYSHEDKFSDPRWKEALKLFKQSYQKGDKKERVDFHQRTDTNSKWEPLSLNLSRL